MHKSTEEFISAYFAQLHKLNLEKRLTLDSLFYFFAGFLSESYLSYPKGLSALFEAFYVLQKLQNSKTVSSTRKRHMFIKLLKDPNVRIEKELNSLLIEDGNEFAEEDSEGLIYNSLISIIEPEGQADLIHTPIDLIFCGFCTRKYPSHVTEVFEKVTTLALCETTQTLDQAQKLKLQAAVYSDPKVDIENYRKQLKEEESSEEVKSNTSDKQSTNHSDVDEALDVSAETQKVLLKIQECLICLGDFIETPDCHAVEICGHIFHRACISEHLKIKMTDNVFPILCPQINCNAELTDSDLNAILTTAEVKQYYHLSITHYMNKNINVVFQCPTPDCAFKLFELNSHQSDVTCPFCEITFCSKCKETAHNDTPCEVNQFMKIAVDLGYKMCPACRHWVEKNEGCDHMTCSCGYEFCYKCGKIYGIDEEEDGYNRCAQGECEEDEYYSGMKELLVLQEVE